MKKKRPRADHDSPWKEVLEAYFPQAMQFFFPQTAALIDWTHPHEFLDKEFQKIDREALQGRRYADKLVKVKLIQGSEIWLLIHIEVQAETEEIFAERMFLYNVRIFDRYHQHAVSLAILCDSSRDWRPNQYNFESLDTKHNFEFGIVKLLDYQDRWAELEQSENPFATVVMAHLKTQQTTKKAQERKTWKFHLVRRLYELGWQKRDIHNLYRFIDWIMTLPKKLEAEFWSELKQFEQEQSMAYITTGERIGYERGREDGKEEGKEELILRLLQKRVGELPSETIASVQSLTVTQLEELGVALLDFTGVDDLVRWLGTNQPEIER
ncbi:MAG: DUF4351 domain-containing protein [Nostocaceae cyanobacterium]|nr:DUF4351 domain-containing protein [Nostocaceae cyanobacterium]